MNTILAVSGLCDGRVGSAFTLEFADLAGVGC